MMTKTIKSRVRSENDSSRTSFYLPTSLIHKINHIAIVERESRNKVVENALNNVVEEWEKQNGKIFGAR